MSLTQTQNRTLSPDLNTAFSTFRLRWLASVLGRGGGHWSGQIGTGDGVNAWRSRSESLMVVRLAVCALACFFLWDARQPVTQGPNPQSRRSHQPPLLRRLLRLPPRRLSVNGNVSRNALNLWAILKRLALRSGSSGSLPKKGGFLVSRSRSRYEIVATDVVQIGKVTVQQMASSSTPIARTTRSFRPGTTTELTFTTNG